jgi:hypothetical protein
MPPGFPDWLSQNKERLAILLIYIALVGTTMHQHAMWRDETQAWLIARDSPNLHTLLHNLRYEGHPALWYLLLTPLTRITRNPAIMQMLNLAIASATVALVLWRAPFTRLERALFPFGYFMLYEYAVKSRGYALGFFLLMLACTLWPSRRRRPVLLASVLGLLANVHLLLMVLSISAACAWWLAESLTPSRAPDSTSAGPRQNLAAAAILLAAWLFAIYTIRPPPDPGYAATWYFLIDPARLQNTLNALGALFTPRPNPLATVCAVLLLLIIAWRWQRVPPAALFYLLSVSGVLILFYLKVPRQTWLSGILFMAFIATSWIGRQNTDTAGRGRLIPPILLPAVLAIQLPFGLAAIRTDLLHPLSNGYNAASAIAARGWAGQPIAGVPDKIMTPIAAYLGVREFYYGNGARWGSFTVWDLRRQDQLDPEKFVATAAALGPAVTLIIGVTISIDPKILKQHGFTEIQQFSGARVPDENYTIYHRASQP